MIHSDRKLGVVEGLCRTVELRDKLVGNSRVRRYRLSQSGVFDDQAHSKHNVDKCHIMYVREERGNKCVGKVECKGKRSM